MANIAGIPVWREIGTSPRSDRASAPIVIVGAGPVGLAMALDLGRRGHEVVVLNRLDFVAAGSKAICFAKRSLDIFDRLGVGQAMVDRGVVWNTGKVFRGPDQALIYDFDSLPVKDQKRPGFINLQQYHVEELLLQALGALPNVDLRWGHAVTQVHASAHHVAIEVEATATGERYALGCDWLLACDGARSTVRDQLGLKFDGRVFEDNFLIADIKMKGERPAERWFWFDPPFGNCRSALLHKQPDDVWRLDFQLGWDVDRARCVEPDYVEPLVRAMLGPQIAFTPEWYSVYTFQCRRMARFVHGRVLFMGDSAHLVSPFGARGCNGGLADVDNLGWKLDLVLREAAPQALLESYNDEAIVMADENILNSTRSTDFITPKSSVSQAYRDAVLDLARTEPFARRFVNSGRLSLAVALPDSRLSTPDRDAWRGGVAPGSPALDAPLNAGWLLDRLGDGFSLLCHGGAPERIPGLATVDAAENSILLERYDLDPGGAYLLRPDRYVAARWRAPKPEDIQAALARAGGLA